MSAAASATSPIAAYENLCEQIRDSARKYVPFTYIVYHSLLPKKDEDWVGVARKIIDFLAFRMVALQFAVTYLSSTCLFLPIVPIALDGLRLVWLQIMRF